jgi:hypothetical protein
LRAQCSLRHNDAATKLLPGNLIHWSKRPLD